MEKNIFYAKTAEVVTIEKMLNELIPDFINNKISDLNFIQSILENKDYQQIKKIGHNWKGACPSYGFNYLGEVGKQFEILIDTEQYDQLQSLIKTLPIYLQNLKIRIEK